jgi:23S rRNA (cytosine1962-C5)-methyltransferase
MKHARVLLKPGREKSLINGNPWIFSGAVESVDNFELNGQPCEILASSGDFLAMGYVNPDSKIVCRVLTRENCPIDAGFIETRICQAAKLRESVLTNLTNACRLVNSEGDLLPGLVIDRYGDGVVIQILTCGMELMRETILTVIRKIFRPSFIVERSDSAARHEEKLNSRCGILSGTVDTHVEIVENGLRFKVDVLNGQKTGFYLDQRDSRSLVRNFARGRKVLNLFSYTGGFSVAAASAGAVEIVSVDSSEPALELARENMIINNVGTVKSGFIKADVFNYLNALEEGWDMIILDPPAFAMKKTSIERAARGYKDINMRSLKKLNPGGILATFSCSHHISPMLFRQIVYSAVTDSGRQAHVIAQTSHPLDHPFNVCHKEGEYLKGIFLHSVE